MNNSIFSSFLQVPVFCPGYLLSGNLYFILVPVSIIGALLVIYFIWNNSKKNFAFKEDALIREAEQLKRQRDLLAVELSAVKKQLETDENQRNALVAEKLALTEEIDTLKKQLLNSAKTEKTDKDEIVIEYYLNEKSAY
jgi:septal ring factor EnvC (AmiA/AmiB activator)